jgi:ribonuclease D
VGLHPSIVKSNPAFLELVDRIETQSELSLDCEFFTEGRYYPHLCLVQLAFDTELWAIDPRHVNLSALAPVLRSENIRKVFHDGRQDLPILAKAVGVTSIPNVFDTQIAAAFAGYGGKIGYGNLVRELCGITLDKSLQVSNWSSELSDAQVAYALDDVRYLATLASKLRTRLTELGRIAWVDDACAKASVLALGRPDPETLYRRVTASSQLSPKQLGILRELAKWRDRVAQTLDRPITTVANDLALKSMALRPPQNERALEPVRGLGVGRTQPWARELLDAITLGASRAEPNYKPTLSKQQEMQVDGLTAVLGLARKFVAVREEIAAELLTDQSELRALAEWHLNGRPLECSFDVLNDWRGTLLGKLLLDVLAGTLAFRANVATPSGIDIIRL